MCGIVGYTGTQEAAPLLLDGLKRLEYRGYDSAGIATLCNGHFTVARSAGKLSTLVEKLAGSSSHALGDARPSDRVERPSPHRLQGAGCRRSQRDLRELR
jgi:glucosamine 6-phosphate synthetase-like amidotransferase/phosphosugar isomerase protein